MKSICTLLHHLKNDCWIDSFSTKVVLPVGVVVTVAFLCSIHPPPPRAAYPFSRAVLVRPVESVCMCGGVLLLLLERIFMCVYFRCCSGPP